MGLGYFCLRLCWQQTTCFLSLFYPSYVLIIASSSGAENWLLVGCFYMDPSFCCITVFLTISATYNLCLQCTPSLNLSYAVRCLVLQYYNKPNNRGILWFYFLIPSWFIPLHSEPEALYGIC